MPVKVTMMLCDAAQVADGKLYVLGGGWSITGPDPVPSAIALKIDVGWHEAERAHHWELFLEDADGRPVLVDTPEGEHPVEVRGEFTVGRPPDIPEGSPIDVALAVNLGPSRSTPGTRYTWRMAIDGDSQTDWVLGFTTRPPWSGTEPGLRHRVPRRHPVTGRAGRRPGRCVLHQAP